MTRTTSFLSAAFAALAILAPSSYAFVVPTSASKYDIAVSSKTSNDIESSSTTTNRRGFMNNVASATAAIAGVSSVWMKPSPAMAYGLDKANSKLARCVYVYILYVWDTRQNI